MTALRSYWRVTAGIIPGQAMPEHTKLFEITSDQWSGEGMANDSQLELFHQKKTAAISYALALMYPKYLNWVNVEWLWA